MLIVASRRLHQKLGPQTEQMTDIDYGGSTFLKTRCISLRDSRLRTLINQSLNWQHQFCKNPKVDPEIKTLFVDHAGGQPNGTRAPSPQMVRN